MSELDFEERVSVALNEDDGSNRRQHGKVILINASDIEPKAPQRPPS